MTRLLALALGASLMLAPGYGAIAQDAPPGQDDYPTAEIADYVFACMAVNGQNRMALERCSCSIDIVRSIVPWPRYQQAETILSMRQISGGGERMTLFRTTAWARAAVQDLRRAQMEAEVRCF
ncbi:hypothetical protein [Marinivivus vitaminiproducens]|uniref:hypothetical protein n=1 Tax=Marinivivus vitaminiproducens TaxID=3035935 RepID=UPI0027A02146|nr:hypothetical protein P4R82_06125 [Geminicoccaceae bacterium SCSIO 64248]